MSLHSGVAPAGPTGKEHGGFSPEISSRWLDSLPASPSLADIESLARHLDLLNAHRLRAGTRHDLSEQIFTIVERCQPTLESALREARVPLANDVRNHARLLDTMLAGLAASYRILLLELSRRLFGLASSGRALLPVFRTMQLLKRRMILAHRLYSTVPKGIWQEMHELHQFALRRGLAHRAPTDLPDTPSTLYRTALLTAFVEPQRLIRNDLERLLDLVEQYVSDTQLAPWRGQPAAAGTFIVKPQRDAPGSFVGRHRSPAAQQGDLVFTCSSMFEKLDHAAASSPNEAPLIAEIKKRLSSMPARQRNRLRTHARVEIYVGLGQTWQFISGEKDERARGHWIVTNESRNGFALMHSGGPAEHIGVGDTVGLHAGNGRSCHLCLVRWVLSDNPEHIEVGLEEISSVVRAVTLRNERDGPVPALLLQESSSDERAAAIVSPPINLDERWELSVGEFDARLLVRPRSIRERTNMVQVTDLEPDC